MRGCGCGGGYVLVRDPAEIVAELEPMVGEFLGARAMLAAYGLEVVKEQYGTIDAEFWEALAVFDGEVEAARRESERAGEGASDRAGEA